MPAGDRFAPGLPHQARRQVLEGKLLPCPERKRVEEIFGWAKTVACFRRTRSRGRARTQLAAHLVAAAHNLLRMSKLIPA